MKNRVPDLITEMMDRKNYKICSEIKRLTEKQLNLKLFAEKLEKDMHLLKIEIKSIKSKNIFNIDLIFI